MQRESARVELPEVLHQQYERVPASVQEVVDRVYTPEIASRFNVDIMSAIRRNPVGEQEVRICNAIIEYEVTHQIPRIRSWNLAEDCRTPDHDGIGRLTDNPVNLMATRMATRAMLERIEGYVQSGKELSGFLPIMAIDSLATEKALLLYHSTFPDRQKRDVASKMSRRDRQLFAWQLLRKLGILRVVPKDGNPEEFVSTNRYFIDDGPSGTEMLAIFPVFDVFLFPLFSRTPVEHWSLLVIFKRAGNILTKMGHTAKEFIVHYDTIPGTNRTVLLRTLRMLGFMGIVPHAQLAYTEVYKATAQQEDWECGYAVLLMVDRVVTAYERTTRAYTMPIDTRDPPPLVPQENYRAFRDKLLEQLRTDAEEGRASNTQIVMYQTQMRVCAFVRPDLVESYMENVQESAVEKREGGDDDDVEIV